MAKKSMSITKSSAGKFQVVRTTQKRQAERIQIRVDDSDSSDSEYESGDEILEEAPYQQNTPLVYFPPVLAAFDHSPRHQTQRASRSDTRNQVSISVREEDFESNVEVRRSRTGHRVSYHSSSSSSFLSALFGSWSSASKTSQETHISIKRSESRDSPKLYVPVHEPAKRERVRLVRMRECEAVPIITEKTKIERWGRERHVDFEEDRTLHRYDEHHR